MRFWSVALLALHLLVGAGLFAAGTGVEHTPTAMVRLAATGPLDDAALSDPTEAWSGTALDLGWTDPPIETPEALRGADTLLTLAPTPLAPGHPHTSIHPPPALDGLHRPPRALARA